jgi:CheY-like chemotaxis protein
MTPAQNLSAEAPTETTGRRGVALIIEDDPQFGGVLAQHLRQAGYQPLQQYRGDDAIAACALRPSLVTLDIRLPDQDGWSVLHAIKQMPHMGDVPVLIISILDEAELGPDCGPTAFLSKPMRRGDLIDAIERLAPSPMESMRVLQVDDDPLIGELLGALLPASRFVIETVTNAQQGAESLARELPDIILLDLVMPKVNGFEFLQAVRSDPRTRHLPVLVVTAKHLTAQEEIELRQAAQMVIPKKSFTLEKFMDKLHRLERSNVLIRRFAPPAGRPSAPVSEVDLTQFREDFLDEARSCLSTIEVYLERGAHDSDDTLLDSAARAAHTLHGSAGMMGYDELGDIAAQAENFLRGLLAGKAALDQTHRTILLGLYDDMRRMVQQL